MVTKEMRFIIKVEEHWIKIQKDFLLMKTRKTAIGCNLEEGLEVLKVCCKTKSSQQKTKEREDAHL